MTHRWGVLTLSCLVFAACADIGNPPRDELRIRPTAWTAAGITLVTEAEVIAASEARAALTSLPAGSLDFVDTAMPANGFLVLVTVRVAAGGAAFERGAPLLTTVELATGEVRRVAWTARTTRPMARAALAVAARPRAVTTRVR